MGPADGKGIVPRPRDGQALLRVGDGGRVVADESRHKGGLVASSRAHRRGGVRGGAKRPFQQAAKLGARGLTDPEVAQRGDHPQDARVVTGCFEPVERGLEVRQIGIQAVGPFAVVLDHAQVWRRRLRQRQEVFRVRPADELPPHR